MNWRKTGPVLLVTLIAVAVLLVLVIVGVGSCGNQTPAEPVTESHKTVGLCVRQKSDAPKYYDALAAGLKELGCGVLLEDSHNDQSKQNEKLQYLVNQSCDVLVVEPVMVSAVENVIAQAKQAQVPLVLLDRQPDEALMDSYDRLYYIGCQSAQAGTAQAQLLDKLNVRGDLNGDGIISYMMLRGPEDHMDAQLITDACNQALAQMGTQLLCTVSSQWDQADARVQCARTLSQYGRDIEVIFCNDAQLAVGAVEAVKNGGWAPGQDVYILGVGTNTQLQVLMEQGAVAATVIADDQQRTQLLVQTVQQLLEGKQPEKCLYADYIAGTAED